MRLKNTAASLNAKTPGRINSQNDNRRRARHQIWLRLAAIFMVVIFLASECATLLPLE